MGNLVLFVNLPGRLSAFHHWVLYCLQVCHKWSLLCWYVLTIPTLMNIFNYEWMFNILRCFFCIYWDDYVVFVFPFVNVVYHIDWFVYVEPSLWSWYKSSIIMVYDLFFLCIWSFFLYSWIGLLRFLATIFIKDTDPNFLLF